MVRKIQIEHVDEYLRCPLFYRYRREIDLPFNGDDTDRLLLKSAKRAVATWFNALGKGYDRKLARAKVGRSLQHLWSKDGGGEHEFALAHARIVNILLQLDKTFNQSTDTPIAGGMLIGAAVDGSLFEDIIDGLYLKNDLKADARRQDKFLVVVQLVLKKDIISPRAIQMQKAMVRYSINSAMKPNPYKIKLLQILVPDGAKVWYDLDKHSYNEFLFLGRSIVRHLDNKMYLPTARAEECRGCAYNTICSNKFCEPDISLQLIGRAKMKLLAKADPA